MKAAQRTAETIVAFWMISSTVFAQGELQKGQLLKVMEASRARYVTMAASLSFQAYQLDENLVKTNLLSEMEIEWERIPGKVYVEEDVSLYDGKKTGQKTQYVFGPSSEKRVISEQGETTGEIAPPRGLIGGSYQSLYREMWELPAYGWERLYERVDAAFLTYEKASKCYVYEFQIYDSPDRSPWLRLWIDPQKEYIPVIQEILFPDKQVFIRESCLNFRKVNGLWVPMKYTSMEFKRRILREFTVKTVEVNPLLDSKRMDFEFPGGTIVEDRLRGVRYKVQDKPGPAAQPKTMDSGNPNVVHAAMPPSATDEELDTAVQKAKEILQAQAAPSTPVQPSAEYVWILPGKQEYILPVDPALQTDSALPEHSFYSDSLTLAGFQNDIAAAGEIRITVNRPQSETGYAEGILDLNFGQQKMEVYLIAPPISDTQ